MNTVRNSHFFVAIIFLLLVYSRFIFVVLWFKLSFCSSFTVVLLLCPVLSMSQVCGDVRRLQRKNKASFESKAWPSVNFKELRQKRLYAKETSESILNRVNFSHQVIESRGNIKI